MTNPLALIVEDDRKLADIFATAVQQAGFEIGVFIESAKFPTPRMFN